MKIAAILFDLDNTLYPASSGLNNVFDERITDYVERKLGISREAARDLRRRYFAQYGTTLRGLQNHHTVDIEDYLAYVHDLEVQAFLQFDAALDQLLGELRATKAIFTNSPVEHAERVLHALGIRRHFSRIFDIRYFDFQPKPHPAIYRRALDDLGVSGAETLLIEDTPQNLPPARALGMRTILLAGIASPLAAQADLIVPDILSALRHVIEWERGAADG